MATRSSHLFKSESNDIYANLYIHWDGYPTGSPIDVINAIKSIKDFNETGCLLLQVFAKLKTDARNYYLQPIKNYGHLGEEYLYIYTITENDFTKNIKIKALEAHSLKILFDGTIDEYLEHFQVTRELSFFKLSSFLKLI